MQAKQPARWTILLYLSWRTFPRSGESGQGEHWHRVAKRVSMMTESHIMEFHNPGWSNTGGLCTFFSALDPKLVWISRRSPEDSRERARLWWPTRTEIHRYKCLMRHWDPDLNRKCLLRSSAGQPSQKPQWHGFACPTTPLGIAPRQEKEPFICS